MPDQIEHLGGSKIQHGPESDRIYLMEFDPADAPGLAVRLVEMGRDKGYGKIFAKVPAPAADDFLAEGFVEEARIPGYYKGEEDGVFLGRFLDETRAAPADPDRIREVIEAAQARQGEGGGGKELPEDGVLRMCAEPDAGEMAAVYGEVFRSYPFAIDDPEYILETMRTHVQYCGVWIGGKLAAVASAETCPDAKAAEMTDFATRPDFRGLGLAQKLLTCLEEEMQRAGYVTAYTIARAPSFGMNIVFARAGYAFGGTLVNNTGIAGGLESMNVWHKRL